MIYLVENQIDFFAEINKIDAFCEVNVNEVNVNEVNVNDVNVNEVNVNEVNVNEDIELCLISGEPLSVNFITLECGHKFNYISLYNEFIARKKSAQNKIITRLVTNLKYNQVQCPYCRNVQNKILPYIPCTFLQNKDFIVEKICGVNYPECLTMAHKVCIHKFSSGIKRNKKCCKKAFETNLGNLCMTHYNFANMTINNANVVDEMSDKIDIYRQKYKLVELKQLLRDNKLRVSGNKKTLIIRLITHSK